MAYGLLRLTTNDVKQITLWTVIKADLLPWLLSAGFALGLFMAVMLWVGANRPDLDFVSITASMGVWARTFYFALVVIACILATRSLGIWTWILAAGLCLFFVNFSPTSLASAILPNSVLPALVAMIGFLALGRIIEYVRMRYGAGLKQPTLSIGSLCMYGLLMIGALAFSFPLA